MKHVMARLGWNTSAVVLMLLVANVIGQPRPDGGIDQATRENAEQLWRDGPKLSPFEGVRWQETTPQVQVNGVWYELVALNDFSATQIVGFCQEIDREKWQMRFQEDLPAVLILMGHDPGTSVSLTLKDLQSGKEQVLEKVEMTQKNRRAIYKARIDQEEKQPTTGPATQPAAAQ